MNIKNIMNLLKAYFIENWKTDLFQFGILATIILFSGLTPGHPMSVFNLALVLAITFLVIYPERLFRNLHSSSPKIHYLSIPASNGEKVVTNMLLANVYFVALLALSCALGLALVHLYWKVRGLGGPVLWVHGFFEADNILMLFVTISVFFFGSIYFRKRTTLSTIGVGLLVVTLFFILLSLTMWVNGMTLIPEGANFHDYFWDFDFSYSMSDKASDILGYTLCSVAIVYFYTLSFLRMKETEV
ncbi:MAG: hypothetical protein K5890_07070 [Bacteroidales bacterium]|nr:hypothetical protein [Bacteroidales bacterium]